MGLVTCNIMLRMFHIHTLSMRMNVGRNGTSYLQRNVTYVPYSDTIKLPYLNYSAGCFIQRLNPNAKCFIPMLNLVLKSSLSKSNLGRECLLYNNSVCNVPYDMNNSLGNTTIHTLDRQAMTFVPPNYLIHQDYLLTFITAVFMTFTFLLILFMLLIFTDDVKSDTKTKDTLLKI